MLSTYMQLKRNSGDTVEHYKTDWRIDLKYIRADPKRAFIHISRPMGTDIVPLHIDCHTDTQTFPYLFGHSTKLRIMTQYLDMCKTSFGDARVWQYFDGKTVQVIDREQAIVVLNKIVNPSYYC